ncbi:MAG: BREX system serine/threonine kinase PglW, partial [Actinomycetes bacterium]
SKHAGVSGRGELHNIGISPAAAAEVALRGLSQTESLSPTQVRSRIAARFPESDRVPQRPHLDVVIAQTGLGLQWDENRGQYCFVDQRPASATSMHTRQPTAISTRAAEPTSEVNQDSNKAAVLRRSIDERGFVAIGVPIPPDRPGEHERVARELAETYGGQLHDVTAALIAGMRELATQQGVPWDLVRSADAVDAAPRDAQGLRAVVDRVLPKLWESLRQEVFDCPATDQPLILTEVSPLARYGHLDVLAKLSDLSAARRRPVWLVLPQLRGQIGPLVDRKPIQLGSPGGQFVTWRQTAILLPTSHTEGSR